MDLRPYLAQNRKLSSRLVPLLSAGRFEPNHVTTAGLLCGIAAGYFSAGGGRGALLWGALFFHLASILDQCDGALARLENKSTRFGAYYDVAADVVAETALWTGLAIGAFRRGMPHSDFALGLFAAALGGSFLHFALILWEKSKGVGPASHGPSELKNRRKNSSFHSVLDVLGNNETAVFVWVFALIGQPVWALAAGAVFINALWMTRLVVNGGVLLAKSRVAAGLLPAFFFQESFVLEFFPALF